MTYAMLDYFVIGQLSAFLLIFCRVGSAMMVLPGIGDAYVAPRIRLLFAAAFSILLTPILEPQMPKLAGSGLGLFIQLLAEIMVGIFIGFITRIILSAIHVAGTIIAFQSSLAVASIFDPITGAQTAVVSNLITIAAMTLFFSLDMHHLVLASLVQSYALFSAGVIPNVADMTAYNIRLVGDAFHLGVMLAAPHIVFSLMFYLAGGLMTRVVPNFQIFFVMMSPQIMLGIFLLFAIVPFMMDLFGNFMQEQLGQLVSP